MASFSDLKIGSFLHLVAGLVLAYHVVLLVEGGRAIASGSSEEEELDLERQLNSLNKSPVKTMHSRWGDIYDCIEFHKQPAFDHPLLKNHTTLKKDETASTRPHKSLMSPIEGCPKGTVPIRRTTKEDLVRAKYFASSSNAPGDEHRTGITLHAGRQGNFFGVKGTGNIWNPKVNEYQWSGAETTLMAGLPERSNEVRFGWTVSPKLYGDTVTRTYAYWTGDGGNKTGCHNTLCSGFVQVDPKYPLVMPFLNTSVDGGTQVEIKYNIDRVGVCYITGDWWLNVEIAKSNVKVGYWPKQLLPLLAEGAEHIYWGGRVRSDSDGILPEMASGKLPDDYPYTSDITGYFADLQYKDEYDNFVYAAVNDRIDTTVDCKGSYNSTWNYERITVHYGGPGGCTCTW
ncbi:hypothetical protein MKW94_016807 [Papaver nudicaule]|uniref:Neprosin PEP catalytic domain-containing protein n=1 Tax=Papaver nudicaule TaxID=74823 RepID=A0AA41VT76_PAPNU|nr:hypothetical protein [Papaver nudicaule]